MTKMKRYTKFCPVCKTHVIIHADNKAKARKAYKDQGHVDIKVPFLEPNVGRSYARVNRAYKNKAKAARA
jgi:hypothetical protein